MKNGQNGPKTLDLGWIALERDEVMGQRVMSDLDEKRARCQDYALSLFGSYWNIGNALRDKTQSFCLYRLSSRWFITEIEEALRVSLMLAERVVIEPPEADSEIVDEGSCFEGGAEGRFRYLTRATLGQIVEQFGDIVGPEGEVILAPDLHVTMDEDDDYRAPDYGSYSDLMRPLDHTRVQMWRGDLLQVHGPSTSSSVGEFPIISGCSIQELIRLRRDEKESFLRWRRYLESLSKRSDQKEVIDAVQQGLSELGDRLAVLRRKGFLEALGATAGFVGAGFAFTSGNDVAGGWSLAATASNALKEWVDQRHTRNQLASDPMRFLWLARAAFRKMP